VEDKQRVVDEFARVVKQGGYVGLNEEIWLKPPTPEVAEHVRVMWPVKPNVPTREGWETLLTNAGLQDVVVEPHKIDPRREATQIKRYTLGDMFSMFWRTLVLYIKSAEFRSYMKAQRRLPKGVFEYFGYVVAAGRR
jgi:hypothetical protein